MTKLLDQNGAPLKLNGKSRPELAAFFAASHNRREVRATYDAASGSSEFSNYWSAADHFDADSAHSPAVRRTLRGRARYEVANNGYADGIAQTYATHLVGRGPALRMLTASQTFNQMVEKAWNRWAKACQLRRKLWTMAHAKHVDGEAFAILRTNARLNDRVKLDLQLIEAEQCSTPMLPFQQGYIDGIRFDSQGNPIFYDVLRAHPGSGLMQSIEAEQVPADAMLHFYKHRRPGQHRGVPESASTLNCGAAARRFREATIAAAETAADFAALIKSGLSPDQGADLVSPMSTLEIQKRMLTALPMGWEATQMKAEHPSATYESFHKLLINEQARPKSMPFNVAACDSSSYNYASGRLDHQTYYGALDVDREDANDQVLDKLFCAWYTEAALVYGFTVPLVLGDFVGWDWPKHRVADVESEANAIQTRLKSGTVTLSTIYSEAGEDFDDELVQMAADYGIDEAEMRAILRKQIFDTGAAPEPPAPVNRDAPAERAPAGDTAATQEPAGNAAQTN